MGVAGGNPAKEFAMKKEKSGFSIMPEEELDLKHQGSVGGEQLLRKNQPSTSESEMSMMTGREPAEGPNVAMASPTPVRKKQQSLQSTTGEGPEKEKSSKKHHYK
jgi:hypothetical protein